MKTAIITGAGRGIGRAAAVRLAEPGMTVVINYKSSREGAEETARLAEEKGAEAIVLQADVSKAEDCEGLVRAAVERTGRIDILVNNAGITRDGLLMRMKEEDFDAVIEANLKSAFLMMREAAPVMLKQRFGRIVNLASVVGITGNAGQANYSASKAGISALTRSFALEMAKKGITVNAVAPGFINTDMTAAMTEAAMKAAAGAIPMGRPGEAEDVAEVIAFLSGDGAGYITGQTICVDGGMCMR